MSYVGGTAPMELPTVITAIKRSVPARSAEDRRSILPRIRDDDARQQTELDEAGTATNR